MFDNRRIRSIAGNGKCHRLSNRIAGQPVFGYIKRTSIGDNFQQRCLRHVQCVPDNRLRKKVLFSMPHSDWQRPLCGQSATWNMCKEHLSSSSDRMLRVIGSSVCMIINVDKLPSPSNHFLLATVARSVFLDKDIMHHCGLKDINVMCDGKSTHYTIDVAVRDDDELLTTSERSCPTKFNYFSRELF